MDITKLPAKPEAEIKAKAEEMALVTRKDKKNREKREEYLSTLGEGPRPYLYVIVATGTFTKT